MQVNANAMSSISNWMNNNSHNVANDNTENFSATRTTMNNSGNAVDAQSAKTQNGTDLSKEMSDQIVIDKSFEANAQSIKTKDDMIGSLLDLSV